MAKEKPIEEQIRDAEKQIYVWSNREKRLVNREHYIERPPTGREHID